MLEIYKSLKMPRRKSDLALRWIIARAFTYVTNERENGFKVPFVNKYTEIGSKAFNSAIDNLVSHGYIIRMPRVFSNIPNVYEIRTLEVTEKLRILCTLHPPAIEKRGQPSKSVIEFKDAKKRPIEIPFELIEWRLI